MNNKFICLLATLALTVNVMGQTPLTKEQIMAMSTDELSELPLEDLMQAVETLGVSSVDELFALIMNKNVSSASKEEESTFTSQLATTVITKDELRSWGATTIEDAFRLIPGMIVSQRNNGDYDIHMRGLNNIPEYHLLLYTNNNNMQLMVDGRPVQNLITGIIQMEQLPISIEDVERIEVVRGACSALYGMNAVTGIVNIITEKPTSGSKSASGSAQIGNMNTYIADFALRKTIGDKWSIGITANGQRRDRNTDKLYIIPAKGIYYDKNNAYAAGSSISDDDLADATKFTSVEAGGFYSISDIKKMRQVQNGTLYNLNEDDAPYEDMFPDPALARRNFGINAYIRYTPKPEVTFDLTGGYQNSYSLNMSPSQDYFSQVGTESKTDYINFDANIHSLHFNANYAGGPQDFCKGVDGYKMMSNNVNAQVDYNFRFSNGLSVRPGVAYNYVYYSDYAKESKSHPGETIGLLMSHTDISTISPSVRAQWSHEGFSATAAVRGDKTSKPDKWNMSYMASASYQFNDNNFLRLSYGHAFRGPNIINTSVNYTWYRDGMSLPSIMYFKGSDKADLMNLDNIEIGYRWKPIPRILLDAELFASKSQDYGAVMLTKSAFTISESQFNAAKSALGVNPELMQQLAELKKSDPAAYQQAVTSQISNTIRYIMGSMDTYSQFQYQNLPFKVYQMGLSLNLDYVISSKLILKLNANIQRTKVDNFYVYDQHQAVSDGVTGASKTTLKALTDIVQNEFLHPGYAEAAFNFADYYRFRDATGWNNWTDDEKAAFEDELQQYAISCIDAGQSVGGLTVNIDNSSCTKGAETQYIPTPLSMYFAMKYGILRRETTGEDYQDCGITENSQPELSNGHKHKATPSVYGMVGLIYKPISQLNISAYANYVGKRTYNTTYSSALDTYGMSNLSNNKLKAKVTLNLKVGYKPTENVEFFFNANNLFNNNKVETIYCDKIGGLYTVGVNFGI